MQVDVDGGAEPVWRTVKNQHVADVGSIAERTSGSCWDTAMMSTVWEVI